MIKREIDDKTWTTPTNTLNHCVYMHTGRPEGIHLARQIPDIDGTAHLKAVGAVETLKKELILTSGPREYTPFIPMGLSLLRPAVDYFIRKSEYRSNIGPHQMLLSDFSGLTLL